MIKAGDEPVSDNALSVRTGNAVTLSAEESYDSYRWTLNGSTAGTDEAFEFDTTGLETGKDYLVGLAAEKDGDYYFAQITVTVTTKK